MRSANFACFETTLTPRFASQAESTRVGFKTVEITSKGVFMVNAKAITVAGVNRHDHHPDTGKTMTIATFLEDITVLKQNNFNAIRTCHYPNSTEFYKLCDYLGMYVCDEANIEVHGMQVRRSDAAMQRGAGNVLPL